MTSQQKTKLERIRAACQKVLELDEKATPGPWKSVDNEGLDTFVMAGNEAVCRTSVPFYCERGDASFIARSRNLSPSLARATLAALDETDAFRYYDRIRADQIAISMLNCFPDDV